MHKNLSMQQQNRQKPGLDIILKQAFFYWKSTLIFQLVFSLIYFSIFFFVIYYTNLKYGIFDQYLAIYQENASNITQFQVELQKLSQSPEYESFYWYIIGTAVFLYPLSDSEILLRCSTDFGISFNESKIALLCSEVFFLPYL